MKEVINYFGYTDVGEREVLGNKRSFKGYIYKTYVCIYCIYIKV